MTELHNAAATVARLTARRERAFETFCAAPSPASLAAYGDAVSALEMVRACIARSFAAFVAERLGDLQAQRTAPVTPTATPDAVEVHSTRPHYFAALRANARIWTLGGAA